MSAWPPFLQGKVKALAAAARLRAGAPGGGGALPELEAQVGLGQQQGIVRGLFVEPR